MKKEWVRRFLCAVCALVFLLGAESLAYTGTLTVAGSELEGTGFWVYDNAETEWFPAVFSWAVTENGDSTWHYEYNLDVYRADVSHFILETSLSFGTENLLNANYPGSFYEIKTHIGSPGVEDQPNPFLPEDIYGAKFDIGDEALPEPDYTSITISFDSDRDPVWGDFYAKCGKTGGPVLGTQNTLWNQGLLIDDPLAPAADGSLLNHILVPDTVPEPATLMLLGLGGLILRKRN